MKRDVEEISKAENEKYNGRQKEKAENEKFNVEIKKTLGKKKGFKPEMNPPPFPVFSRSSKGRGNSRLVSF